jgi:hypothetical protein
MLVAFPMQTEERKSLGSRTSGQGLRFTAEKGVDSRDHAQQTRTEQEGQDVFFPAEVVCCGYSAILVYLGE